MQFYIQNFVVKRLVALNFPGFKDKCKWVFRNQGQGDQDTYKELMSELVRSGYAKPDLDELGSIVGLSFDEIKQLTAPPPDPAPIPPDPKADPNAPVPTVKAGKSVLDEAVVRVAREVGSGKVQTTLGYRNRFVEALVRDGFSEDEAKKKADGLYEKLNRFIVNAAPVADNGDDMKNMLQQTVDAEIAA